MIENDCFLCFDRARRQAERQAEVKAQQPRAKKPKKVTPEMEQRQQKAAARMLELGVSPLQV